MNRLCEIFLKLFLMSPKGPLQFFVFCNRMDVKNVPRFYNFRLSEIFKMIIFRSKSFDTSVTAGYIRILFFFNIPAFFLCGFF